MTGHKVRKTGEWGEKKGRSEVENKNKGNIDGGKEQEREKGMYWEKGKER